MFSKIQLMLKYCEIRTSIYKYAQLMAANAVQIYDQVAIGYTITTIPYTLKLMVYHK